MPTALITGITGQDGSYLAELLLDKGYKVHGLIRAVSTFNISRILHLSEGLTTNVIGKVQLHYGDLTDSAGIQKILKEIQPDEIYNLAAQSQVRPSYDLSEYTLNVDAMGVLYLFEAILVCGLEKKVKFFQPSSSEMYGKAEENPQNENTPFQPKSVYAIAKLCAHWIVDYYRDAHGVFACNGILFNHESPRRGETFVTQKIVRMVNKIHLGMIESFELGNLETRRDWGHAKDYVKGMWQMLQQEKPDDYVLASGQSHSVKEFVESAFIALGREIYWEGEGVNMIGKEKGSNIIRVKVNPKYFRKVEGDRHGDYSKAFNTFGWKPTITFQELVSDMMTADPTFARTDPFA